MKFLSLKWIVSAAAMTAMLAAPVQRADAGNEFVGGLVGGMIGGAIGSGLANQQRTRTRTRTKTVYVQPRASSVQRQQAREVQTALNYFGFNAGVADGVLGARSRAAISSYQAFMGYPATGQLSEYEKTLLLGGYHRAVAGGPDVSKILAQSNQGARAVLIAQRDAAAGTATATTGYAGLPIEVSRAVDEVANSSDPSAEQLLQRSGFIQLADLNGDGNTDYIIDTALAGSSFWCNASQCKAMVFVSTPQGYSRNDLLTHSPTPASFECVGGTCQVKTAPAMPAGDDPTTMAAAQVPDSGTTAGLTLPVFNTRPKQKSLASHCSKVNLLTSANGGFTTVADFTDPGMVMNEQLCLTRTYAVARGEELMDAVQGVDQATIEAQCDAFGQSLAGLIGELASKPPKAVLSDASALVLNSGMTPEQLRTTAQICMASGYQTDKMAPALGGALLLTALGERPYAELVGHHLQGGFGIAQNTDQALAWYSVALQALDAGAAPVFAPGQSERIEVLRKAAHGLAGNAMATPIPASGEDGALPVFNLK